MLLCPACGFENADGAAICRKCQKDLPGHRELPEPPSAEAGFNAADGSLGAIEWEHRDTSNTDELAASITLERDVPVEISIEKTLSIRPTVPPPGTERDTPDEAGGSAQESR